MSDHKLINQLSELRALRRAPALWREQTRERVLRFAESTTTKPFSFSEAMQLRFTQVRFALAPVPLVPALVVVAFLSLAQAPFTTAMNSALPGSSLYTVKRFSERVSLSFHPTPEGQGLAYLGLAQQRLQEAAQVTNQTTQAKLLRDYNISLGFAQASFQAAPVSSQLAVRYDTTMAYLQTNLKKLTPVGEYVHPAYAAANTISDKLGNEALAVLVAVHQSGQDNLLPADVAQRLEAQIAKVETKLSGVEDKFVTLPVSKTSPRVVIDSQQVVVPVREARQLAKQSLTEAKQLMAKREFVLALQKVQESEDIASKTEAAVDKAAAGKVKGAETSSPAAGDTDKPDNSTPSESSPAKLDAQSVQSDLNKLAPDKIEPEKNSAK